MRLLEELELGSVSGGWGFDDDTPPPGGDEPDKDKRKPRDEQEAPEEPREQDDKVNTPPEEYCDSDDVEVYLKITKDPSVEGSVGLKVPKIPGLEVEGNLEGGGTIEYVKCKD